MALQNKRKRSTSDEKSQIERKMWVRDSLIMPSVEGGRQNIVFEELNGTFSVSKTGCFGSPELVAWLRGAWEGKEI